MVFPITRKKGFSMVSSETPMTGLVVDWFGFEIGPTDWAQPSMPVKETHPIQAMNRSMVGTPGKVSGTQHDATTAGVSNLLKYIEIYV
jgi:hypothetical protein